MEVQSRMKCKWNLQSLHLRFGHSGMGLFQFQGSERCKLIGGDFQGGDAKTLRNWATVLRYFGRCKAWLSKAHWASTSTFCSTICRTLRIRDSDSHQSEWPDGKSQERGQLWRLRRTSHLWADAFGRSCIRIRAASKRGHHESRRRRRGRGSFGRCCTGASAHFRLRLVPLRVSWHSTLNWCHGAWEWPPRTWLWSTYITWPWASPISGLVDPSL